MNLIPSRNSIRIGLILFFISLSIIASENKKTQVLENGTTFIHTFNSLNMLEKEEIILKSGRHKITFYDMNEQPQYGVVHTGTGSFGLMYYDEAAAPLFKFFDYKNGNKQLYILSENFKKIYTIDFYIKNNKRMIHIQNENKKYNFIIIQSFFWGMIFCLLMKSLILKFYKKM